MVRISIIVLSIFLLFSVCRAGEQQQPDNVKYRESYSLGYEFGSSVKRQGIEADVDTLLSAARDALEGRNPALPPEEIRDALKDIRRKVTVAQQLRHQERLAKNLEEGKAFLEANKTKEGVKTLPSGLQYTVLVEGRGPVPKSTDMVKVHYRGTLINGTEFDSSYSHGKPLIIHANGMMRGWTEALQLMKVGSKWKIFVPTELAYAERPFGRIPPNSALIFEIELLDAGEDLIPKLPEMNPVEMPSSPINEDGQNRDDEPEE
jgi:FKBP-type peptidyl-prolyl cis-trans isomerase FklB